MGYSVNGVGMGDLVEFINKVTDAEIGKIITEYENSYEIVESMQKSGKQHQALREAAKI